MTTTGIKNFNQMSPVIEALQDMIGAGPRVWRVCNSRLSTSCCSFITLLGVAVYVSNSVHYLACFATFYYRGYRFLYARPTPFFSIRIKLLQFLYDSYLHEFLRLSFFLFFIGGISLSSPFT